MQANQLSALMEYYSSIEFMTEILMSEVRFPSMCGVNCDMHQLVATMQQMMGLFLPASALQWDISEEVTTAKICQTYPILLSTVMLFAGGHIAQHSSSVSVSVYIRHDIPSSRRSAKDAAPAAAQEEEEGGCGEDIGVDMAGLFDSVMIEIKGFKYVENKAVDIISKEDMANPETSTSASASDGNAGKDEDITTHYNDLKLHKMPTADTSEASMRNYTQSQDTTQLGAIRSLPVSNMLDTVCGGCQAHLSSESGTLTFSYWAPYCGSELSSEESLDNTVMRAPPPMPAMKHLKTSNVLHVLVVDDDVQLRNVLSNWLADLGCVVDTAETGRLGLVKLKADVFDIVFVDFLMPVMSGVDMLREYRRQHSEILTQSDEAHKDAKPGEISTNPRSSLDHAVFVGMLCGGEGFGLNPEEHARDAAEQGVHVFTKKPLEYKWVKELVEKRRFEGVAAAKLLKSKTQPGTSVSPKSSTRRWYNPLRLMERIPSARITPF